MNKKQNLLAIALSASFVLAGANVAEANDQVNAPIQDVDQAVDSVSDQKPAGQDDKDANLPQEDKQEESKAQADPHQVQASADEEENKKSEVADAKPLGSERSAGNEGLQRLGEKTLEAQGQARESAAPAQNEGSNKEAPKKDEVEEAQPKAPKPLTDEEVAKLEAAAKRVRPGAESVKVDPTTGWITVKTKVKVKKGDEEVEEDREETINPYTPAGDEALIKNFDDKERYRSTQMEQGNGPSASFTPNDRENEFVDGYRYNTLEPSPTSPDKTKWGFEIEFDKEKGQRTYTDFGFTNSGNMGNYLDTGSVPANSPEDEALGDSFKTPNYKATTEIQIDGSRSQRNLNAVASEEDLKRINNINNNKTIMAWEGHYKKENTRTADPKATNGDSASFTFTVNPWPNENDKLNPIKLEGEYKDKVFVQGQKVNTGVKVQNLDENAKKRLVGQVYNPNTGKVVPGAKAYIDENGIVQVEMPKGAINKDGTLNKESIFYKDNDYKGIQSLDVKFFARPRTEAEFRAVGVEANFGEDKYTKTGAGTKIINHNGENVEVDLQGIDRYDHYNLIGNLKLNLDDTRYYDQSFIDGNNEDTSKNTSSAVKPGEPFEVKIYEPKDSLSDYIKSSDDMNQAKKNGEASGEVILDFINKANEGKEDKDKWKVTLTDGDIGRFTITPPKSAKAGDFVAIPVEYTYTNGSKDTHWFHFVVQESDNNRPEYFAKIGFKGDTLTSNPTVPEDTKKNKPLSYELVPGTYKDSAGNVWDNIKVDPTTGVVTAVIPEHADIKGGENLFVDVKVNYKDEFGIEKEETVKAQFIARPKYKQEVTKEFTSQIPFETKIVYDDTLAAGIIQKTDGVVGESKTTFSQVVINGEKGIINEAGQFVKDQEAVVVDTIKEKQDAIIRIGTKPAETTVEIPRGLDYELDYTRKDGDPEVVEEGNDGLVTITTTRNPETGEITVTKTVTTEAKNKKIKIPAKTEGTVVDTDEIPFGYTVEFDPEFYKNYPDAKDNYVIVEKGVVGTNKKTWTIVNSQIVGDYKLEKTDPVNAVIKVGQKDYTGTVTNTVTKEVPHTVKVVQNPDLPAGTSNVKQKGVAGSKTYEYSGEIVNGQLKEGTQFTEKELTEKNVDPIDEIIEIGTKPAENQVDVEKTVDVIVEYVYDSTKEKGYRNIEDLVPGKVITKVVNKYNPETGKIESIEETTVIPGTRRVTFGTKDYTGEYEEIDKNIVPYTTEIVFDSTLKAGDKEIDQPGIDGETITKTKRHLVNGEVVSSDEPVTEETKKVQNQIIRVGTMTNGDHTYTEKLPFNYEITYDPNLKAGEYVVDVKGEEGSKTTKWTIENSKVVEGSASVIDQTAPTNAKIRVGNKDFTGEVKHTEHFEIPFEVEVRYNDQLPAGKSNEIQKGEKGSYDVEYKQDFKNGELVGEMTKTESNRKDSVKHIIEVGTKPVEGNTHNIDENVNVEIEYVYDENLEKGKVETGELIPGKVTSELVNKIVDGKVVTEEVKKVTSAKQIVKVGSKDFTGTYEYKKTCPIPFEVEVREDPTLSKGEKKIEQQGAAGSKTTSYKQAIKNGEAVGNAKKTGEEVTVEPTKHIVLVGTKPLEGNTENVVDKAIPYGTKVIYDENLEAGTRVVDNEGKDGKERVTTTITTKDGDITVDSAGKVIEEKEDRVVRVGIKPVVKTEEIPHDTTYTHNPNLAAGTVNKISDGTPGTVTITTTFNKETGKLETKVTRTEPNNAVYEYGSLTEGSFKVESEIPYKVQVIEDNTLDAGTHVVDQEGVAGKKETTVKVKNSKEESREEKTITAAVDKIIRVGTKPNANMCPAPEIPNNPDKPNPDPTPETPEIPGEDEPELPETPGETPEDPEKPGEDKPNEPGKPGETPAKPENSDKENPNTPEGSKEDPKKDGEKLEEKEANKENVSDELSRKRKDSGDVASRKSTNPKTGIGSIAPIFSSMGISIAGLLATRKKKEDEE